MYSRLLQFHFFQENQAIIDMIKTQHDKLMHLIVTKISYKESCHDHVKVYQIVAAASFYINKSNTSTFLVYVGIDCREISMSSFGLTPMPPAIRINKNCLGTFLVAGVQKISFFRYRNYEMCLQANHDLGGPKMFYQKLMFEAIQNTHLIVNDFKKRFKNLYKFTATYFGIDQTFRYI